MFTPTFITSLSKLQHINSDFTNVYNTLRGKIYVNISTDDKSYKTFISDKDISRKCINNIITSPANSYISVRDVGYFNSTYVEAVNISTCLTQRHLHIYGLMYHNHSPLYSSPVYTLYCNNIDLREWCLDMIDIIIKYLQAYVDIFEYYDSHQVKECFLEEFERSTQDHKVISAAILLRIVEYTDLNTPHKITYMKN